MPEIREIGQDELEPSSTGSARRRRRPGSLQTSNEVRNEPIRRLNERHGYVLEPGVVIVRRAIG